MRRVTHAILTNPDQAVVREFRGLSIGEFETLILVFRPLGDGQAMGQGLDPRVHFQEGELHGAGASGDVGTHRLQILHRTGVGGFDAATHLRAIGADVAHHFEALGQLIRFVGCGVEERIRHRGRIVGDSEQLSAPLSHVSVIVVENAGHIGDGSHHFLLN